MNKKLRFGLFCALIVLVSTVGAWSLSGLHFFENLNLKASDAHFVFRERLRGRPTISNIVMVTADQHTFDTFTDPTLFWHKHYADAIAAAAENGAKVIGLDLAFGIPVDKYEPGYDEMMGGAVSAAPIPVVVGYLEKLNSNQAAAAVPINMISAALGLGAFTNITSDLDDFTRRQELIERPSPNANDPPPARSLALRVVEKYLGADAEFQNGHLMLQGHEIPVALERDIAINYAGGPNTFPSVSLADFEAAAKAGDKAKIHNWVNGKVVLIGTDFRGVDRQRTPFYTPSRIESDTAGVEVHANTIRTLLEHSYLLQAPEWARALSLIVATALIALITILLTPRVSAGLTVVLVGAVLGFTHLSFESGWMISTSEILIACSISLLGSVTYRFATAEKRGKLFQRAVSVFVGKQLATSLDETEAIGLSGKRLTVTILFTDIRGFTAFTEDVCEKQGPEAVVTMLNEYMADMCAVIVKYHGHVNKFIGDGILAVFSDDDEGAIPGDHAVRTVKCATEMVSLPGRFSTGAGIHTGPAVVGNVGSADKMEYTVLGDTVNLASRLESLNKEHHTKLLMSGVTEGMLDNKVETVHLGDVPVRGKAHPIPLFTVASLVPKAVANA